MVCLEEKEIRIPDEGVEQPYLNELRYEEEQQTAQLKELAERQLMRFSADEIVRTAQEMLVKKEKEILLEVKIIRT